MHTPLHDSIVIRRWRNFHLLILTEVSSFLKIDRESFICKWFCHAINLRSNRLTMEFLSGFRLFLLSSLHKKWPHVLCQLKRFVNDAIQFDVNISIKLNAHCAHIYTMLRSTEMILGEFKNHRWLDRSSHCITCAFGQKKGGAWRWPWQWAQPSKAAFCSKIGRMMFGCSLGSWQHCLSWCESIFFLALLYASNALVHIVCERTTNSHTSTHTCKHTDIT